MAINEKWLQGKVAQPGDYENLRVEELLISLLNALNREQDQNSAQSIESLLPPVKEASAEGGQA